MTDDRFDERLRSDTERAQINEAVDAVAVPGPPLQRLEDEQVERPLEEVKLPASRPRR